MESPSAPRPPDQVHSSTHTLPRCFIGRWVRLPSGVCHQSVPSLHAAAGLFGLIRAALPIFSQVPLLLNPEPDSCVPRQTQGPGCPQVRLQDAGREGEVRHTFPHQQLRTPSTDRWKQTGWSRTVGQTGSVSPRDGGHFTTGRWPVSGQ